MRPTPSTFGLCLMQRPAPRSPERRFDLGVVAFCEAGLRLCALLCTVHGVVEKENTTQCCQDGTEENLNKLYF